MNHRLFQLNNMYSKSNGITNRLEQRRAQAQQVQARQVQARQAQARQAQAMQVQAMQVQAMQVQARQAQARQAQARSAQARPAQARPAQARPAQASSAQAMSAQARPAQASSAQAMSAQARPAQASSAQAMSAQARQAQARQAHAKQAHAKQVHAHARRRHATQNMCGKITLDKFENIQNNQKNLIMIADFPIDLFKNKNKTINKLKDPIKIDLAVPTYYGNSKSKRDITILFFKYLRYISDKLANMNIQLSVTIVGSDNQDSLDLFNTYVKKNELDTYIEFDQKNTDYKSIRKNYTCYDHSIFSMLHAKFHSCFVNSWEKDANIYCLSGSNDFIDINYYIDAARNYDAGKSQIYGLNKRKNITLITSNTSLQNLNEKSSILWNLDYGFTDGQFKDIHFSGGIIGISPFCKNPEVKNNILNTLLNTLLHSREAYNETTIEKIFINTGDCFIETINGCFSINYKVGDDLTSLEMVNNTICNKNEFDITSKKIIFTKCYEFWNKILSL